MDKKEAEAQLKLIQQAQSVQQTVGRRETGWFLLIWGVVWLVGFLTSHFVPDSWLIWVWLGLGLVGGGLSAVVGMRLGQQVQYTQTGPKLGQFYLAFTGFCMLWLFLVWPEGWEETAVLAITFLGFAVVVNGILLNVRPLLTAGLVGTVLTVAIYLWLTAYFGLIVGLLGGGGMIIAGLNFALRGPRRE